MSLQLDDETLTTFAVASIKKWPEVYDRMNDLNDKIVKLQRKGSAESKQKACQAYWELVMK